VHKPCVCVCMCVCVCVCVCRERERDVYKAKVPHSKYSCIAENIYELLIVLFCNLNIVNVICFVLHRI